MEEKIIIEKLKHILPNGFELAITEELKTRMISFRKKEAKIICSIQNTTLNDRVYNDFLGNVLGKIIFTEVEYLLFPKYKIGNNNPTIDYYGHQKAFGIHSDDSIFSQLPLEYKTEKDIDKGCTLITKYINEIAIPFFNYWQDIRDFLPFLEINDPMYIQDIFCGDGIEKKIIIWKLCCHPKFEDYKVELLQSYVDYLKENPKDKWAVKDFDRIKDIYDRLEKTSPLYEWDEKYLIEKPYIK